MWSCLTNVTFAFDDETNLIDVTFAVDDETNLSAHKVIRQKLTEFVSDYSIPLWSILEVTTDLKAHKRI